MIIFFILPSLILLGLLFGYPFIRYLWLSFHASSVLTSFDLIPNNGANWMRIINDQRFWVDLYQTLRFAGVSVTIEIIIAILLAIVLDQRWRGMGGLRTISLLPWALPTTVMALGWRWIFNTPYGILEKVITFLGLPNINFLSNPDITWLITVIADVWKTTPFITLIILAGLQTIPNQLYEAFELEGGHPLEALTKLTLPLILPYIQLSIIFRLAQAIGVFDLIQIMTGGGPAGSTESIAIYAYINAMRFLDFGYSSTIMIASFIILIVCSIIAWTISLQIKNKITEITS